MEPISKRFGLVLDQRIFDYHLGNSHPMNTNRVLPAYWLFQHQFVDMESKNFELVVPAELDRNLLLKAVDEDYVEKVEQLSNSGKGGSLKYGLGSGDCPVWPGMAEASEFIASSTVSCAERIYQGELDNAFVMLGGLHHAQKNRASGFCYYNDCSVAIHKLKEMDPDIKILYIDTDLHHGDGTQFDFYNDPNVLTYSTHESGHFLFPGSGFSNEIGSGDGEGKSLNLPLFPFTTNDDYWELTESILPVIFEDYQPDFVIWQAGVDGHAQDYLGHLQFSTDTFLRLGQTISNLAEKTMDTSRILTLGGGGYNPDSVARSWAHIVAGLTNTKLPTDTPEEWIERCVKAGINVSASFGDGVFQLPEEYTGNIEKGNDIYKEEFLTSLSPYFSFD